LKVISDCKGITKDDSKPHEQIIIHKKLIFLGRTAAWVD
jgi:hypothetical protein